VAAHKITIATDATVAAQDNRDVRFERPIEQPSV
jgi:hypothetical protein